MSSQNKQLTGTRPQLRYTWQDGDDLAVIAEKYGVDPEEILDFNLIEEHEIKAGDELKLPSKHKVKEQPRQIRYEALPHPVIMHVNQPNGIQKYAFGHITDPDDVKGSGHFPHATKIVVCGIAHVPVEDESLAYYMDHNAFGDYKTSGKVNWNIGYAWSELSEGPYVPPPVPTLPEKTILDEPDEPLTMFDHEPEPPVTDVSNPLPTGDEEETAPTENAPKDNVLMPINHDYTPEKFLYEEDIEIAELYDRHDPIKRRRNDPVWIIATFWHEGTEYYQPGKAIGEVVQSGLLWPIPMDAVLPEEEVFDFSIKRRQMTKQEKWWELLNRGASNYTRLTMYIKQKRNKE